ncbi:MAG: transglutaminase-like domain-containing protein, partial [Candidatus Helarchaeota archaeon]
MNPDSDADGLLDGVEVIGWPITVNGETYTAHSNPLKIDTDNDGLTDLYEMEHHFDPEKPDTDGDGRGDFEQSGSTTEVDTDGDGLNDNL